jgi:hypothetical protein
MDLFPFFFVAYRQQGSGPVDPVVYLLNMDRQDEQDIEDETLLQKKLTRAKRDAGCL